MNTNTTAAVIVALQAMGMALAFILADRRSPTSQALGIFLTCTGLSIAIDVLWVIPMRRDVGIVPWEGVLALPQALAVVFAFEWVLRVRETIPAANLKTHGPNRLLRIAQGRSTIMHSAPSNWPGRSGTSAFR